MSPPPADLTVPRWSRRANAGRIFLAVRNGVRGTAMSPRPDLSDRQIWQLVAHVESLGSQP